MEIALTSIHEEDIPRIAGWARNIAAEQYMGRIYPRAYLSGAWPAPPGALAWYAIRADGLSVGTLWLERDSESPDIAWLGILIGDVAYLGRGIGRVAIDLAVDATRDSHHFSAVHLNVRQDNTRAIRCYEGCGFTTISESIRRGDDGIQYPVFTMARFLE